MTINKGDRQNAGVTSAADDHTVSGVIVGLVGPRQESYFKFL